MNRSERISIVLSLSLIYSACIFAQEEKILQLNGNDKIEVILEKVGAPKNSSLPLVFKNKDLEIKISVNNSSERVVNLDFNPPSPFSITGKDTFEYIESAPIGDMVNHNLIVADPSTGRIFHLTNNLTVSQLDLVPVWKSKQPLKSLKDILTEIHQSKIRLKSKKKQEVKK